MKVFKNGHFVDVEPMSLEDMSELEAQYRKGFEHGISAMQDGIKSKATEYDFDKFFQAVHEWRHKESLASMTPAPYVVVSGKKINKKTPLFDKPVHFLVGGKIEKQGVIIGFDKKSGDYFVQMYSWLTGYPTRIAIVEKKYVEDVKKVRIYESDKEWKDAYEKEWKDAHEKECKPLEDEEEV